MQDRPPPVTAFCSYAHADEALRRQLETHLAPLRREGLIDLWQDHRIEPGQDFDQQIRDRLYGADHLTLREPGLCCVRLLLLEGDDARA